jgi:hypothetical protein
VAGNSAGYEFADMNGSYTDGGGNLIGTDVSATSLVNPGLAPLANYGGPTQTQLPQPGSPAICAGLPSNVPGRLITDQRGTGYARRNSAYVRGQDCVDAGAVETHYALSFSVEPPFSVTPGSAISPAPVVELTESGAVTTAGDGGTITITDSDSLLSGTTTANLSGGSAFFSNILLSAPTISDTLTAALPLNPVLSPALILTTPPGPHFRALFGQTINFTPVTGINYALKQLTLSGSATSGLPINFSSSTPAVCFVSGNTVSLLTAGDCVVHASQVGNDDYLPAAIAQSFGVFAVPQSIAFTPITGKQYAATQLTLGVCRR